MNYNFSVEKTTQECISYIQDWFRKNGPDCNAVLGISGGKDSTIAAALCVKALGKDRVIGVLLPNGEQSDLHDAMEVCNLLNIKSHVINIESMMKEALTALKNNDIDITKQASENLPPRIRTSMIRAICQCFNGRMVNTCNFSENYLGYFTVGGDGDGDFSPLGGLTATEVIAIGRYLGLPAHLIDKPPADGLCGKTDEDNFGFTYSVLDHYLRTGEYPNAETKERIDARHRQNRFKMVPTSVFDPNLP